MSLASGGPQPAPFAATPTETCYGDDKEIFFNGEAIQLLRKLADVDLDVLRQIVTAAYRHMKERYGFQGAGRQAYRS